MTIMTRWLYYRGQLGEEISEDEKNLLYVAVTRATKRLQLTSEIMRLLKLAGEEFWYLTSSSRLPSPELPLKCMLTGRGNWTPPAVTLAKQKVQLGDGTTKEGGLVCPQAFSEGLVLPNVRHLVGSLRDDRENTEEGSVEHGEVNWD
ncbi:hypothetical protein LSAT2_018772 [Lamellibrachia satsuma]|nr:hypothetical protein LSAT2_018772 [Lamellibrachia satsuma]